MWYASPAPRVPTNPFPARRPRPSLRRGRGAPSRVRGAHETANGSSAYDPWRVLNSGARSAVIDVRLSSDIMQFQYVQCGRRPLCWWPQEPISVWLSCRWKPTQAGMLGERAARPAGEARRSVNLGCHVRNAWLVSVYITETKSVIYAIKWTAGTLSRYAALAFDLTLV